MKAYVNGTAVTVMEFFKDHDGISFCRVRVPDCNWIIKVPSSMIELR